MIVGASGNPLMIDQLGNGGDRNQYYFTDGETTERYVDSSLLTIDYIVIIAMDEVSCKCCWVEKIYFVNTTTFPTWNDQFWLPVRGSILKLEGQSYMQELAFRATSFNSLQSIWQPWNPICSGPLIEWNDELKWAHRSKNIHNSDIYLYKIYVNTLSCKDIDKINSANVFQLHSAQVILPATAPALLSVNCRQAVPTLLTIQYNVIERWKLCFVTFVVVRYLHVYNLVVLHGNTNYNFVFNFSMGYVLPLPLSYLQGKTRIIR